MEIVYFVFSIITIVPFIVTAIMSFQQDKEEKRQIQR